MNLINRAASIDLEVASRQGGPNWSNTFAIYHPKYFQRPVGRQGVSSEIGFEASE